MKGKLVVIEGLDGSGKATQTALLYEELQKFGCKVKKVSFPDYDQPSSALVKMYLAGEFGERPESVNAYAAASFYAVDRFASFTKFWRDSYQQGAVILADRYVTSNMIFQLSKLPPKEWNDFLSWEEDFEYQKMGLPKPDLTIYLDMPPKLSQQLLGERYHGEENKKDIHEKNLLFLEQCRKSAIYTAERLKWKIVNCACDDHIRNIEEIHAEIMQIIGGISLLC